jgi:hypothetical protein
MSVEDLLWAGLACVRKVYNADHISQVSDIPELRDSQEASKEHVQ